MVLIYVVVLAGINVMFYIYVNKTINQNIINQLTKEQLFDNIEQIRNGVGLL